MEERITELEVRIAYQESTIASLDEVVRDFSKRVETLERLLREIREGTATDAIGPGDDPPPHY